MNKSAKIASLIKRIAQGNDKDTIKIYMFRVLYNTECSGIYNFQVGRNISFDPDNLVIAVKVISDLSSDSGVESTLNSQSNITDNIFPFDPENNISNYDIGTILPNVRLLAGVDDGPVWIPKWGSNVIVLVSTYNDPFIIQYSAMYAFMNSCTSQDLLNSTLNLTTALGGSCILNTLNNSSGIPQSGSVIYQQNNNLDFFVADNLTFTPDLYSEDINFNVTVSNYTEYKQTSSNITFTKSDGLGIQISNKFDAYNSTQSLSDIITKLNTAAENLNSVSLSITTLLTSVFASGSFAAAASAWAAGVTAIDSSISSITTDLTDLSTEISSILGH